MANFFKEEIAQFGETVDKSIQAASERIQVHIDTIGKELNNQRTLTRADIEALIDYSAEKFGRAIDTRIETAKVEIATLVTEKLAEVRGQLTDAADEQKRTAVRNAMVAVAAAILIGIVSLVYQRFFHGETNLLSIFRVVVAAIACGHAIWLGQKYLSNYFLMPKEKKNVLLVGAQYFGVLKPKGALGHLFLLMLIICAWAALNFWPQISQLLVKIGPGA
jgi:hypothetical protein